MKRIASIILGVLITAYCLVCWFVLETRNNAEPGGVLQAYHEEYAGGGSMKWRFPAHGTMHGTMRWMPLYDFIESFGLLVYPVALAGIAFSGFLLLRRRLMLFSLGVLAICLATLTRFVMLGVFRAALEF